MRPLVLKIKGINSFIEEQIVDFVKLSEQGLFGIFGPTGSGKTTILDAMMLALYGQPAVKSSNFINVNLKSANVSFLFQVTERKTKRYLVEREFKFSEKTNSVRSGKGRIFEDQGEELVILADTITEVNKKVIEIIGLRQEDFQRTVVLPQGRFSEFLKLEGKERREMLERLFHLEKYGDCLANRLSIHKKLLQSEMEGYRGELQAYSGISNSLLEEKKKDKNNCEMELNSTADFLEAITKQHKEAEEIWKLQEEEKEYHGRLIKLEERSDDMKGIEKKIVIHEGTKRVKPYLEAFEQNVLQTNQALQEQTKQMAILQECKLEKERVDESFQLWHTLQQEKLPKLYLKQKDCKDAVILFEELREKKKQLVEYSCRLDVLKDQKAECMKKKELIEKKALSTAEEISVQEKLLMEKTVDPVLREQILAGASYEEKKSEYEKDKEHLEKRFLEEKRVYNQILPEYLKLKNFFNLEEEDYEKEQEKLAFLQKDLYKRKEARDKYNAASDKAAKNSQLVMELSEKRNELLDREKMFRNQDLEFEVKIKKEEQENLAQIIRQQLEEGVPCPVCGSIHHVKHYIEQDDTKHIAILKKEKEKIELQIDQVTKALSDLLSRTAIYEEQIQEDKKIIKELGAELGEDTKEVIQEKLEKLDRYKELRNKIFEKTKSLRQAEEDYKLKIRLYNEAKEQLIILQDKIHIKDFLKESSLLIEKDKEAKKLSVRLKKLRDEQSTLLKQMQEISIETNKCEQELVSMQEGIRLLTDHVNEKRMHYERKLEQIQWNQEDKAETNIHGCLEEVELEIKRIERNSKEFEQQKKNIEETYSRCQQTLRTIESRYQLLQTQQRNLEKDFVIVMEEQGFHSQDEVKAGNLEENVYKDYMKQLSQYKEEIVSIQSLLTHVREKLGERRIEKAEWEQLEEKKLFIEKDQEEKKKLFHTLEHEINEMEEKLLLIREVLKKQEKAAHIQSLIEELEKLFKGKKFVEFVAISRLKYISIDAAKRLQEITNGNYGIEVDETGRFMIRDFKNGGVTRDASTLSGGETFLVSLALALALSQQIQLKGTAPLELFFLDEGFGTLDDNLLDVVMSSIEKIHHERLKVGLISHVESVKTRIPVKLLVKPSVAGKAGTHVEIEKS
ncbi:SbcC/MukB-like Walker B domain-containing protein [Anaeromicropila populeti]|uniref:Nuclease SbcCD subunit C n=1 Tax=Anaeromicropila populeti TaxID=37658 RepID=A0A1I6IPT6_9FIRM|nr:AAA family ATPase [Anaeromicropila populeti]SFR68744.1 exonuclease SbcC [Anaeromicropila populeti]